MKTFDAVLLGFGIGCAAMFIIAMLCTTPDSQWRKEAVERGHAEYYLDKDFNRQWKWK